jgi:hypothetical protein
VVPNRGADFNEHATIRDSHKVLYPSQQGTLLNNMCPLQFISGIVMSQLISELVHHVGRGKITTLLGIDVDEFTTDKDTERRTERKFKICYLYFILHHSRLNVSMFQKIFPKKITE